MMIETPVMEADLEMVVRGADGRIKDYRYVDADRNEFKGNALYVWFLNRGVTLPRWARFQEK